MALPYTSLIESLENEVQKGTFTAWSCANAEGTWAAFYADEACPPDWVLDKSTENDQDDSTSDQTLRAWFPAFDLASLSKPLLANALFRHALGTETLLYNQTPLAGLLQPRSEEGLLLKQWAEARPWLTLAHCSITQVACLRGAGLDAHSGNFQTREILRRKITTAVQRVAFSI